MKLMLECRQTLRRCVDAQDGHRRVPWQQVHHGESDEDDAQDCCQQLAASLKDPSPADAPMTRRKRLFVELDPRGHDPDFTFSRKPGEIVNHGLTFLLTPANTT